MPLSLSGVDMLQQRSERISAEEALDLLTGADTAELMSRADGVRRRRHGTLVHYVHSLNLNPTNLCENRCGLCAFWREPGAQEAYTLSLPQVEDKLTRAQGWGLTDVHIVGGLNRELDLDYYLEVLRITKRLLPSTAVQALTAVEVQWLSDRAGQSVTQTLAALTNAGLDALPGGGAEVFSARVRENICPRKISAEQWLRVHEIAHGLGLASNATMLFGHVETPEEIIDHLHRLRTLQDRTGGFQAFCPLPFHARGTQIGVTRGPGGHTIARIVALARLFLDNFPHIRVLANFLDRKLLQTLLFCGADDIGGTSLDEEIARAAGAPSDCCFRSPEEMAAFIRELGLQPMLTDSLYARSHRKAAPARVPPDRLHAWEVLQEAESGKRLSLEEAVLLHDTLPFSELGRVAHMRRRQVVGDECSTFIIDRNIKLYERLHCRLQVLCVSQGPPAWRCLHDVDRRDRGARGRSGRPRRYPDYASGRPESGLEFLLVQGHAPGHQRPCAGDLAAFAVARRGLVARATLPPAPLRYPGATAGGRPGLLARRRRRDSRG